jgi:hypothetical protein
VRRGYGPQTLSPDPQNAATGVLRATRHRRRSNRHPRGGTACDRHLAPRLTSPRSLSRTFHLGELRTVCHLLIYVERPCKKGTPTQCHRCQRFHHLQRNCHAQPMCAKCCESQVCKKTRDAAAKCVNCGGPHTASYRGCPRFPRGHLGKKTPLETQSNPSKNRASDRKSWRSETSRRRPNRPALGGTA